MTDKIIPSTTITLKLDFPYTLASGDELKEVTLRAPTVRDRLMLTKDNREEDEAMMHFMAKLCGFDLDAFLDMKNSDYMRIEKAFNELQKPMEKRASTK